MEYIKEININEAVIHVLDNNSDEPILNEYALDLDEEKYNFLLKHIQRCLKDEGLRYAVFNKESNIIKDFSQQYLNGENNLLDVSKELAREMFTLMRSNGNVPSCDLIVISFTTEFGPILAILKMDYIKNYMHSIEFIDNKMGVDIVPQFTGLPGSGQKVQKCAFIKPVRKDNEFDLMVIDKLSKNKVEEEHGATYFINNYLGCEIIDNERDMTKKLITAAEKWVQNNYQEDAAKQEKIRSIIKNQLQENSDIDIEDLTAMVCENEESKGKFTEHMQKYEVAENVMVDKEYVEKKLKKVRLKIDKDIDIYINADAYKDNSRFEIQSNGDGTINMVIKHVSNYIEK